MNASDRARHAIAAAATLLAVTPFLLPTLPIVDQPVSAAHWLLVGLSAVANVMVLTYHHVVPPHPKFVVLWWRRTILHVHIGSGSVEFLAGVAGCALGGHALAGTVMAVVALLFHVPSAFMQTAGVFGSRAIMRPSYLMCIGLHGYCAAMLLVHPTSLYWTVATFLLFNTYVWVRVFYYLLDKFGFFADSKYTVAVVLAGLTTTPTVLGPAAMLAIAIGWAVFISVHAAFFVRSRADLHDFVRERARDSAYSDDMRALWDPGGSHADLARAFFKVVDRDGDGAIHPEELEEVLSSTSLRTGALRHFMESRADAGRLAFDAFFAHLWTIPELRRVAREVVFTRGREHSDRDKARFVFDRLDLDGDGRLGREELEGLLTEWAMPAADVRRWTRSLGLADNEDISFDLFFGKMRAIWRFIYYDVIEARFGSREDLIQRVFSAWRDESEVQRVEDDLRHRLVRDIPFLQGADDAFVHDVASSFVEETWPAGTVLFEQGSVGEDFWVVVRGCVRVTQRGELLGDLRAGASLGEGSLLERRPRAARAVTTEETVLFRASRASFLYLLERYPTMRQTLEAIHVERRVEAALLELRRDLLTRVPFLERVDEAQLRELASRLRRVEVDSATVVLSEDSPTEHDMFFLISAGSVRIQRDGAVLAELMPGQFFGEATLLDHGARAATAVATAVARAGSVLYGMTRGDFEWIAGVEPSVGDRLRERAGR